VCAEGICEAASVGATADNVGMMNVVVEEIHYHLEEPLKVLCSDETREPLQDWASKLSKRLMGQQAFEAIDVDTTSVDPSSPVTHELGFASLFRTLWKSPCRRRRVRGESARPSCEYGAPTA
jgi:hypothetical protein